MKLYVQIVWRKGWGKEEGGSRTQDVRQSQGEAEARDCIQGRCDALVFFFIV